MKFIQTTMCLFILIIGQIHAQSSQTIFKIKVPSNKVEHVQIKKYNYDQGKMEKIKSFNNFSQYPDNKFTSIFSEPSIYLIETNTGKKLRIAVEREGLIDLIIDNKININSQNAVESNFEQTIKTLNEKYFGKLIKDLDVAMKTNDKAKLLKLEIAKEKILISFIKAMEDSVRDMGASAQAFDALQYFDLNKNLDFLKEMNIVLRDKYPNSGMSKSLSARIHRASITSIGKDAPNINTTLLNGSKVSLKDFKGIYLLIDFWASWCRACRIENPKIVDIYNRYKNRKFEVISVSIDKSHKDLKKAIKMDKLPWKQVHDPNYSIYNQYQLSSLPSNFLLDKNGKIIAKNVKAEELEMILSNEISSSKDQ
ncbi:TlpA disulfide reductase family protein [Tamlana sp. 2201CG12-4]|uniref:TlpA family protein disulfide reductase n=1 Tax=Tamlana sp. 2201CG12-4 TaxID=3112582 RepID=UPI002DB82094|nr:TlpA disulfide reductase family protein [Tamlana sp. 2201CG12-4]MEC3908734.1 TlpA disulfide reductase family protein [Tamlana sp. 2201CG12-4]